MTDNSDFFIERQKAIERMKNMSRSSAPQNLKTPDFVTKRNTPERHKPKNTPNDILSGFNLPFLNNVKTDGDISLLIGLLFILYAEKADKFLLYALLYILF